MPEVSVASFHVVRRAACSLFAPRSHTGGPTALPLHHTPRPKRNSIKEIKTRGTVAHANAISIAALVTTKSHTIIENRQSQMTPKQRPYGPARLGLPFLSASLFNAVPDPPLTIFSVPLPPRLPSHIRLSLPSFIVHFPRTSLV